MWQPDAIRYDNDDDRYNMDTIENIIKEEKIINIQHEIVFEINGIPLIWYHDPNETCIGKNGDANDWLEQKDMNHLPKKRVCEKQRPNVQEEDFGESKMDYFLEIKRCNDAETKEDVMSI